LPIPDRTQAKTPTTSYLTHVSYSECRARNRPDTSRWMCAVNPRLSPESHCWLAMGIGCAVAVHVGIDRQCDSLRTRINPPDSGFCRLAGHEGGSPVMSRTVLYDVRKGLSQMIPAISRARYTGPQKLARTTKGICSG
jgi:hypothetical protein